MTLYNGVCGRVIPPRRDRQTLPYKRYSFNKGFICAIGSILGKKSKNKIKILIKMVSFTSANMTVLKNPSPSRMRDGAPPASGTGTLKKRASPACGGSIFYCLISDDLKSH